MTQKSFCIRTNIGLSVYEFLFKCPNIQGLGLGGGGGGLGVPQLLCCARSSSSIAIVLRRGNLLQLPRAHYTLVDQLGTLTPTYCVLEFPILQLQCIVYCGIILTTLLAHQSRGSCKPDQQLLSSFLEKESRER